MSKASDIKGTAQLQGDYGEDMPVYSCWEIYGQDLIITEEVYWKEDTFNGNPSNHCLVKAFRQSGQVNDDGSAVDPEECKIWMSGRLTTTAHEFFKVHPKGTVQEDTIECVIYLDPVVDGETYNGWTMLDPGTVVEDHKVPDKAAKRMSEQLNGNKSFVDVRKKGSKELAASSAS